jgi:hypothetical protein
MIGNDMRLDSGGHLRAAPERAGRGRPAHLRIDGLM